MGREAERLARAIRNAAKREKQEGSLDIRAGTVLFVDPSLRVAQVKLDGEVNASSVKWMGGVGPAVGDRIHVLVKDGVMTVLGIPNIASSTVAAPLPQPTVPNMAYINALNFWGHSYLDPGSASVGASAYTHIAPRVFSALGISWPHGKNFGQGGSILTTEWRTIFRTARPSRDNYGDTTWQAKFGPQAFLYGANDVGRHGDPTFESSRFLNDWSNCWRGVLSFFRAGAIYTPDWIFGGSQGTQAIGDALFPGGKAGVTYGGTWTSVTGNYAPGIGADARQTTVTGSTIAVRLPPNFPGTPVTLYFAAEVGATGSTNATVTHGGTSPVSPIGLVTNDRVRTPSTYQTETPQASLYPVRITGIPVGDKTTSQTITVNAGTLAANHKLTFLGWTIEAPFPPLLLPANVPPAGNWAIGAGYNTANLAGNGSGAVLHWACWPQSNGVQTGPTPTGRTVPQDADTWCRNSYNPALVTVSAEFQPPGSVSVADLATAADGSTQPALYGPNDLGGSDDLHPNGLGRAAIALAYLTAINRIPLDPRHLIAPWDEDDSVEAADMLGATT